MPRRATAPDAEVLALEAVAFLADSPADFARFLALSGANPADLRAQASERHFLAGVVDFLLSEEPLLMRFCAARSVDPEVLRRAREHLSPARNPAA